MPAGGSNPDPPYIQVERKDPETPCKLSVHSSDWTGSKAAAVQWHPNPITQPDLEWVPLTEERNGEALSFSNNGGVRDIWKGGYVRLSITSANSAATTLVIDP